MIKNYILVIAVFLCSITSGLGQVTENFNGLDEGAYGDYNINGFRITNGLCNWENARSGNAVRLRNLATSLEYIGSDGNGKDGGVGVISFWYRSWDGAPRADYNVEISVNNGPYNVIGTPIETFSTTYQQWTHTLNNSNDNIKIRVVRLAGERLHIDDFSITDYTVCTDIPDNYNIQWPVASPQTITDGDNFSVYARAFEPGVTDASNTSAGTGLEAWIGVSSSNSNPSTWLESSWIPASYNLDNGGYDEFMAEIGSGLATGTYYYASRFRLNGCDYVYGGVGGAWSNNSVELQVLADQVDFCNVDFPKTGNIIVGNPFTVYAQAYEPGITNAVGQGANIQAWIGYNTIGENHQPWDPTGWTWIPATYESDFGNNDQYEAEIGSSLPVGTYYYASRFQLNGSDYSYGGIQSNNVGNFWWWNGDTTYNSGTLTVNNPPLADVVITEIMYNTIPGADDEWIEICNVSGSTQNLSGYIVSVNSTNRFSFPVGSFIADGDCLTVSLGSSGDATYNPGCPFTPDYGISPTTSFTNILQNTVGPHVIQLFASDGTSLADSVAYSSTSGANGNGASLHVTDIGLDNSNTNSNWQEVANGGSAGINFLVSPCTPIVPEIDVERNTSATIPNGALYNNLYNTIWTTTNVGESSNKTFFVRNEGYADLTVSSMTSSNSTDFVLVNLPSLPIVLAPGEFFEFEISFAPSSVTPVTKDSTITIISDDADEGTYTFRVRGTAGCPLYTGNLFPASGPIGTEITITSNEGQNLTGATATLNGAPLTVLSSSTSELLVKLPDTITTGGALVVLLSGGCTFTSGFSFIDQAVSSCEGSGGSNAGDIFISQVTDSGDDSFTYIELYNGTGSPVNLNNYSLHLYNNGRTNPISSSYIVDLNNVNLLNGDTYVVALGLNDMDCATEHNPSGLADQQYNVVGVSLNFSYDGDNNLGHDHLRLYNNSLHIDSWGEHEDESWATSLNLGGKGANFMRRNDVVSPNDEFTLSDWIVQDWGNTCADLDYSDIGTFDFLAGTPPSVSILNPPITGCNLSTSLTVTATEGYDGAGDSMELVYEWFYSAPGETDWTPVPDNATYDNVNTNTLQINDVTYLNDYQYYCEVRENNATCFVASNAIKLEVAVSIWTSGAWTPTAPDINTIAVIDDNYIIGNSVEETSFEACSLIITSTHTLNITDEDTSLTNTNNYVRVQNDIIVDGEIYVDAKASLVQVDDAGTIVLTNASAKNTLSKYTHPLQNWYDYTYWSSPLEDAQIETALFTSNSNRRFEFLANQFNDDLIENQNLNTFTPGQDDIDDNGDDWFNKPTGSMTPGVGYAATHSNIGFIPGRSYQYVFEGTLANGGAFNTGDITVPIYINPSAAYNNWNFIGNPYPSAINAQTFFEDTQSFLEGVIYLWSHSTDANNNASGNQNENFTQDDYAIINYTGGLAAGTSSPTGSDVPNGYVPSGQGFFVIGNKSAVGSAGYINPVVFNNGMRVIGNNTQFFRSGTTTNKLWVNLTSDNGAFNQILLGYVDGATNAFDGMHFDAPRNLSSGNAANLYMTIPDSDKKFAIQGKNPNSLNVDEEIPLGFHSAIDTPTIFKLSIERLEGSFLSENTIYVKDKLLNIVHNLSESEYAFTSETGTFETRFEIVFRADALSVGDSEITPQELSIFELPDGRVKFTVGNDLNIESVEIFDILGRTLYNLKGNSSSETFDLSNLSQAAYVAKVKLSNGQIITKRAIKRK